MGSIFANFLDTVVQNFGIGGSRKGVNASISESTLTMLIDDFVRLITTGSRRSHNAGGSNGSNRGSSELHSNDLSTLE
jgi:hypothetical protein